jgi:hypothetical protein
MAFFSFAEPGGRAIARHGTTLRLPPAVYDGLSGLIRESNVPGSEASEHGPP